MFQKSFLNKYKKEPLKKKMTNIWTDSYKAIREPFFEIGDPYIVSEEKKKEKKDEDKKEKDDDKSSKRWWDDDGDKVGYEEGEVSGKFKKKVKNEEVEQVDEAQAARNNPEKYEREQEKKYAPVRGEKTPMPPRGNKRREDFEKWYRANVKEERELHSKTDKNEKIDVRRGIKNKIEVNPKLKEEVEEWVNQLVEEGYNLSDFTWDEVYEIYESVELDEVSSYGMPPAGDAQREKPDPLQAAKRRAAQAQVRKELSDLQVAKARSTAKLTPTSEEAIFSYLENRYDLSEGVFDPKKTKLRSASERKASELSPAQKKAAEMKQKRSERLEAEADKVLRQVRGGGSTRKSSKPMGSEGPKLKAPAPEANRKLGKQKQDTLAKRASDVLKDVRNK
jgi:hypothetical protein